MCFGFHKVQDWEDTSFLNHAWRFINSKKEQNEKIFWNYYFCEESDLYDCCKSAIDCGYNYCPECGNYVKDSSYNNKIESRVLFKYMTFETTKDFEDYYIEYNDLPSDWFDDIDVEKELLVDEVLYEQCKEFDRNREE